MVGQTVRIGSREIAVALSPVYVNYLSSGAHDKFVLNQSEDGRLTLQSSRSVRVIGWIFCVLGWPVLLLGIISIFGLLLRPTLENALAVLFLFGWGIPFSLFGVKLLGRRCLFDSRSGELTIRRLGWARRRSLADILAVQVINAGWFGAKTSDSDDRFVSYQLNLIRDDPNEPRLFVAFNSDLADMSSKAKLLADFLGVPLLTSTSTYIPKDGKQAVSPPTSGRSDPTRNWATTQQPLPAFDLTTGALGGLALGDDLEKAKVFGRPDRVEYPTGGVDLDYRGRGFMLEFQSDRFIEVFCTIAIASDGTPEPGQGCSKPRLTSVELPGGIELTPDTSAAKVQECLGPPDSEEDFHLDKILTYEQGRFSMAFEFEQTTGRLLNWSATLNMAAESASKDEE